MITQGPSIIRLAKFVNGNAYKPEDFLVGAGYPVVRIRQLLDENAALELAQPPDNAVWVDSGDLVFSWSASLEVRFWRRGRALLNQHLFRVDVHSGIERRWFAYVLDEAVRRLRPLMHGSAMTHITLDMLAGVRISVPPKAAQRAIADYLDRETARTDALIGTKKRIVALLDERLNAVSEASIWFDGHHARSTTPLRRLALRIDVGIAEAATHAYAATGVPLLRSMNIRRNYLDTEDLLFIAPWFAYRNRSKYIRAGDILTVRTGDVGVSAVVPRELHLSQCFTQLITTVRPPHSPEFVCYALNSGQARDYLELSGWGSAQSNISVPLLAGAPIPQVEPAEQKRLVRTIYAATTRIQTASAVLSEQISRLEERRRAVITTAVTGELEIPGVAA
ncbi:MAG: restriction endonuclease subunit S [Deltaproteobacteria bacterium]|nr:restriction endonuclease subunit S [Deltaproteobacteria bacterium]